MPATGLIGNPPPKPISPCGSKHRDPVRIRAGPPPLQPTSTTTEGSHSNDNHHNPGTAARPDLHRRHPGMSTFVKPYPRAKVSRHATLEGWVIDLILKANAKPIRVNATYASIAWAHKAANQKLGVKDSKPTASKPKAGKDYGTCDTCQRPMRPAGSKASDYPGTTLRQRAGLCQSCNNKTKAKA